MYDLLIDISNYCLPKAHEVLFKVEEMEEEKMSISKIKIIREENF